MKRAIVVLALFFLTGAVSGCCVRRDRQPGCFQLRLEGLGGSQSEPQGAAAVDPDAQHGHLRQSKGGILRWIYWFGY
jgi:hypothetical protein